MQMRITSKRLETKSQPQQGSWIQVALSFKALLGKNPGSHIGPKKIVSVTANDIVIRQIAKDLCFVNFGHGITVLTRFRRYRGFTQTKK